MYTRTISHHVLIRSMSFLQILTCWKIVLQNEKQSQTKISLWVLLKKIATEMSIWHRQERITKGKHSRISEDEAIPTVLNCTHEPRAGQQTLPRRSCSGTCCTAIPLVMESLSYCFCWTLLQEAAVKGLQCHSSHDLGEPLGSTMKTNMSPCHREASL